MSEQTRTTLKGWFESDDIPTGSQYSDLIDSCVNISDDGVLVGGEDNISAAAGGGQGPATQLSKRNNRVTSVSNPGDSVKLPPGIAGMCLFLYNGGGNALDLFPSSGEYINALAVDTALSCVNGAGYRANCYTSGKWWVI